MLEFKVSLGHWLTTSYRVECNSICLRGQTVICKYSYLSFLAAVIQEGLPCHMISTYVNTPALLLNSMCILSVFVMTFCSELTINDL